MLASARIPRLWWQCHFPSISILCFTARPWSGSASLAATVPFDDRLNQRARVEDLSRDLMREFLTEVGSDLALLADSLPMVELGRQMNVVGGATEAPFPLNVGLLFFNPEPHRFFPATQIDVAWFPDGPGGDRFTEKIFRGPLHRMVREALDYVRRNYISETVIKHPDRAEATRVVNFPYAAVEEAVVNAIYHRSYEEREPVEVRVTPHELTVLSFPGPDRSIRLDQLRAGRAVSRRYRNRRIGEFLKESRPHRRPRHRHPEDPPSHEGQRFAHPRIETDEDRESRSGSLGSGDRFGSRRNFLSPHRISSCNTTDGRAEEVRFGSVGR